MAVVKLSDTWPIEEYAIIAAALEQDETIDSPVLRSLDHWSLPGLHWRVSLYPRGVHSASPDHASVYVEAIFGAEKGDACCAWADWRMEVVAEKTEDCLTAGARLHEYLPFAPGDDGDEVYSSWGVADAFERDALEVAVRTDRTLVLKLDLSIYKVADLLKCRDTIRVLLSEPAHADFAFKVENREFRGHRAILAATSNEFAAVFAGERGGMGEGSEMRIDDTTAAAFEVFLGAVYFESFGFLTDWQMTMEVLKLTHKFKVKDLHQYCDAALADSIKSRSFAHILQILPVSISCNASVTKSACIQRLLVRKNLIESPEWVAFKEHNLDIAFSICEAFHLKANNAGFDAKSSIMPAPEVEMQFTWSIPANCVAPNFQPPYIVATPSALQSKAFPLLKWKLELHPRGNRLDPECKPGFASLYLKALFGPRNEDLKAVYAKWKATISGPVPPVSAPETPQFNVYAGQKDMRLGYANAFPTTSLVDAINQDTNTVEIRFDLTVASIPDLLKCRQIFCSLRANAAYTDVEISVNGIPFKERLTIFRAHKCVLAARSNVFAAMFDVDMQETKTCQVKVNDAAPTAFDTFLGAVYYENWDFLADMDATIDVLKLAEKYGVLDLKTYCDEALSRFVCNSTLFDILPHAAIHNAERTKATCVGILFANEEMMRSGGWIQFKKSVNKDIMADIAEAIGERYRAALKRKHEDD